MHPRWRAALGVVPAGAPITLLGFSMGGGVAIAVAGDVRVAGVVALAPWVPDAVPLSGLAGKRLAIVHGGSDRYLPFCRACRPPTRGSCASARTRPAPARARRRSPARGT